MVSARINLPCMPKLLHGRSTCVAESEVGVLQNSAWDHKAEIVPLDCLIALATYSTRGSIYGTCMDVLHTVLPPCCPGMRAGTTSCRT